MFLVRTIKNEWGGNATKMLPGGGKNETGQIIYVQGFQKGTC